MAQKLSFSGLPSVEEVEAAVIRFLAMAVAYRSGTFTNRVWGEAITGNPYSGSAISEEARSIQTNDAELPEADRHSLTSIKRITDCVAKAEEKVALRFRDGVYNMAMNAFWSAYKQVMDKKAKAGEAGAFNRGIWHALTLESLSPAEEEELALDAAGIHDGRSRGPQEAAQERVGWLDERSLSTVVQRLRRQPDFVDGILDSGRIGQTRLSRHRILRAVVDMLGIDSEDYRIVGQTVFNEDCATLTQNDSEVDTIMQRVSEKSQKLSTHMMNQHRRRKWEPDKAQIAMGLHIKSVETLNGVRTLVARGGLQSEVAHGMLRILIDLVANSYRLNKQHDVDDDPFERFLYFCMAHEDMTQEALGGEVRMSKNDHQRFQELFETPVDKVRKIQNWSLSRNTKEILDELGIGNLHSTLYRQASGSLHGGDYENYAALRDGKIIRGEGKRGVYPQALHLHIVVLDQIAQLSGIGDEFDLQPEADALAKWIAEHQS